MQNTSCQSCGSEQPERYCPFCGEERVTPELRSSKYLFKTLFTELTDLDGKVWRTLKNLIIHPGQIDYDYSIGRRKIYIKPVTLFLIINVFFVMFSTLSDFYVNFYSQVNLQNYSQWTTPHLLEYVSSTGLELNQFGERYDQLVKVLARSLIILQVPFFAFFVAIICYRKNYFSGDYMTFSLTYHSWFLIMFTVIVYPDNAIAWINQQEILPFTIPYIRSVLLWGLMLGYMTFAMRKMFQFGWVDTLIRLPFLFVGFGLSHALYRFTQLVITVLLVDTGT